MSRIAKYGRRNLGVMLGVFALVVALTGTAAVAGIPGKLKLGNFNQSSRDRLAGTGVIQYAAQTHTVADNGYATLQTFTVNCEKKKKATAGGYKIAPTGAAFWWQFKDSYPTGSGFKVRLWTTTASQIQVYANCVKSRKQRGTPPL